jgi:hypothetical protein
MTTPLMFDHGSYSLGSPISIPNYSVKGQGLDAQ